MFSRKPDWSSVTPGAKPAVDEVPSPTGAAGNNVAKSDLRVVRLSYPFDFSVHEELHASGKVKPISQADLAARIASLKAKKKI